MERRVLWTVVLVLASVLSVSCGDDGGDESSSGKAGTNAGTAGKGGTTSMGNGMKLTCEASEVTCGTKCCGSPAGLPNVMPCCADEFAGQCGMLGGFGMTRSCVKASEPDARCPSVMIPVIGFVLASCCTTEGMCGINAGIFGQSGCTELGQAAMMAAAMAPMPMTTPPPTTDEDGGVAGAGGTTAGGAGAGGRMGFPGFMFPAPRKCDQ
jgi:hypothetical protein